MPFITLRLFFILSLTLTLIPLLPNAASADAQDFRLRNLLEQFNMTPLPEIKHTLDKAQVHLGRELFFEQSLSGNKNISCATCHHPDLATGDALPFSIGQGGIGLGRARGQGPGPLIRRHAPALFGLYGERFNEFFWDGRVSYNPLQKTFKTPEPALNGAHPVLKQVTAVMSSGLAAQTLFPLTSPEEMLGNPRDNEMARSDSNLEIWSKLLFRLLWGPDENLVMKYRILFRAAYPRAATLEDLNIGHVGEALASFIKSEFGITHTPYDDYLRGDDDALSGEEKKGLEVFLTKGQCVQCHNGPNLADFRYLGVGVPQVTFSGGNFADDFGRFEVTGSEEDRYKFRVPGLRNAALTGPYMHNGSFSSLKDVIEHYNDVEGGLNHYTLPQDLRSIYINEMVIDRDTQRNQRRFKAVTNAQLRQGLQLTAEEKEWLEIFLTESLTEPRFR